MIRVIFLFRSFLNKYKEERDKLQNEVHQNQKIQFAQEVHFVFPEISTWLLLLLINSAATLMRRICVS